MALLRFVEVALYLLTKDLDGYQKVALVVGVVLAVAVIAAAPFVVESRVLIGVFAAVDCAWAVVVVHAFELDMPAVMYMSLVVLACCVQRSRVAQGAAMAALAGAAVVGVFVARGGGMDFVSAVTACVFMAGAALIGLMSENVVSLYEREMLEGLGNERALAHVSHNLVLSRDSQDALTKSLYSCSLLAQGIVDKLEQRAAPEAEDAHDLLSLIRTSTSESAQMLAQLRQSMDNAAMYVKERVEAMSADYGRFTVACDDVASYTGDLPWETRLTVARAIRELLENIDRYTSATAVAVSLNGGEECVALTVAHDAPPGMPLTGALRNPGYFGLNAIRDRLVEAGGTLALRANGRGTVIEVRLPVAVVRTVS
jgi:signal transduction histidine kinase